MQKPIKEMEVQIFTRHLWNWNTSLSFKGYKLSSLRVKSTLNALQLWEHINQNNFWASTNKEDDNRKGKKKNKSSKGKIINIRQILKQDN